MAEPACPGGGGHQQEAEMSRSVCSSWEAVQTGGKHCWVVRGAETSWPAVTPTRLPSTRTRRSFSDGCSVEWLSGVTWAEETSAAVPSLPESQSRAHQVYQENNRLINEQWKPWVAALIVTSILSHILSCFCCGCCWGLRSQRWSCSTQNTGSLFSCMKCGFCPTPEDSLIMCVSLKKKKTWELERRR